MIGRLMRWMLIVIIISFFVLMLGGFALDHVQNRTGYYDSFFNYRIRAFDDLPYYFVAALLLLAANGVWLVKLSVLKISGSHGSGYIKGELPIHPGILLGGNLILDVAMIVAFIYIRSIRL